MNDILAAIRSIGPAFRAWAVPFCAVAGFLLSASLALRDLFDRRPRLRVRGFVCSDGTPTISVEVVNVGRVAVAVRRIGLLFADGSFNDSVCYRESTRVDFPCALSPGEAVVREFFLTFPEERPAGIPVVPAAETSAGKVFYGRRVKSFASIATDRRAVDARVRRRRRDCFPVWTRLRVDAFKTVGEPAKKEPEKQ